MSISLLFVLLYPLVLSAVLVALNKRGVGAGTSTVVVIVACLLLFLLQFVSQGSTTLGRQALQQWLLFICVPTAVLSAVARFGFLQSRPGLLLVLGPLSFVFAIVVVTLGSNIFAGRNIK